MNQDTTILPEGIVPVARPAVVVSAKATRTFEEANDLVRQVLGTYEAEGLTEALTTYLRKRRESVYKELFDSEPLTTEATKKQIGNRLWAAKAARQLDSRRLRCELLGLPFLDDDVVKNRAVRVGERRDNASSRAAFNKLSVEDQKVFIAAVDGEEFDLSQAREALLKFDLLMLPSLLEQARTTLKRNPEVTALVDGDRRYPLLLTFDLDLLSEANQHRLVELCRKIEAKRIELRRKRIADLEARRQSLEPLYSGQLAPLIQSSVPNNVAERQLKDIEGEILAHELAYWALSAHGWFSSTDPSVTTKRAADLDGIWETAPDTIRTLVAAGADPNTVWVPLSGLNLGRLRSLNEQSKEFETAVFPNEPENA